MEFKGRKSKNEKPEFLTSEDRGFTAEAWYLEDTADSKGDAIILIKYRGELVRDFIFPAYKIWNIAAHFKDIADGEIENSSRGYVLAASTGLEGFA